MADKPELTQKNEDPIVIKMNDKNGMINFGGVDLPYMAVMRVLSSPGMEDRKIDMQVQGTREQMTAGEFMKKIDKDIDRAIDEEFDPKNGTALGMVRGLSEMRGLNASEQEINEKVTKLLPLEREMMHAQMRGDASKVEDVQREWDKTLAAGRHEPAKVGGSQFWEKSPSSPQATGGYQPLLPIGYGLVAAMTLSRGQDGGLVLTSLESGPQKMKAEQLMEYLAHLKNPKTILDIGHGQKMGADAFLNGIKSGQFMLMGGPGEKIVGHSNFWSEQTGPSGNFVPDPIPPAASPDPAPRARPAPAPTKGHGK